MITPMLLPKQGNSVETCLILEWKKKQGEEVKKGEIVCEIETDKAVFDIESPADGILLEIFFGDGQEAPVLTNIAVIGRKGENYAQFDPRAGGSPVNRQIETIETDAAGKPGSVEPTLTKEAKSLHADGDPSSGRKGISPRARNLADSEIAIEGIHGTGPGGRIIERDIVEAKKNIAPLTVAAKDIAAEQSSRPHAGTGIGGRVTIADMRSSGEASSSPVEDAIKVAALKGIRKLIADRMLDSLRNSAQLTLNSSADATALLALRSRFKTSTLHKEFQAVTINDLVHYAVVRVLPDHPELNSLLKEDQVEYHTNIHLGFAVDTPRGTYGPGN